MYQIAELKEKFDNVYNSPHINWRIWASLIQASEPQTHQTLINNGPPRNIIHLFRPSSENAQERRRQALRATKVASNENGRTKAELEDVKACLLGLKRSFDDAFVNLMRRVDLALDNNVARGEILADYAAAEHPEEVPEEGSAAIRQRIMPQDDIDHAPL